MTLAEELITRLVESYEIDVGTLINRIGISGWSIDKSIDRKYDMTIKVEYSSASATSKFDELVKSLQRLVFVDKVNPRLRPRRPDLPGAIDVRFHSKRHGVR